VGPGPQRLRAFARVLTAGAFGSLVYLIWANADEMHRPPPAAGAPLRLSPLEIDWSREPFQQWGSAEDGVALVYPSRFEAVRGLGRFTSRDLRDGLTETDVVAFRSMEPRAVIVVAAYRAARPLGREAWVKLAKAPGGPPPEPGVRAPSAFSMEFGGSAKTYRRLRIDGREALAVSARGAVKYPARGNERMELWQFESRLLAEGERAVRITAGVHLDHAATAAPAFDRVLASFRWTPERPAHRRSADPETANPNRPLR